MFDALSSPSEVLGEVLMWIDGGWILYNFLNRSLAKVKHVRRMCIRALAYGEAFLRQ